MRSYLFYMLACGALATGCQPLPTVSTKTIFTSPKVTEIDTTLSPSTTSATSEPPETPVSIESVKPRPTVTKIDAKLLPSTPSATAKSPKIKTSSKNDENSDQTKINLPISTIATANDTQPISEKALPNITPQIVAISKTFDPTKIIGFSTPVLLSKLGKANMVRKEGPIEVWQYHFANCVVDFFFYPNIEIASQLIAKSWDMRSLIMGVRLDEKGCRAELDQYHQKISSNS